MERAGVIGLPVPGVEIKLVPSGAKQELRIRGPHVTPGYLRRPDLTADAFDEEDFYRIGDAGRLADPEHPEAGIVFDGRVAEDFKLSSGTWVHAGAVRIAALSACSPLLQDAVVCGHDRDFVALLAWPNVAACKEVCPDPQANDDMAKLLACPEVVARIRAGLGAHNDEAEGTSARIARLMLMAEPPSVDANEITDKGYINQAAALDRRVALVERLYAARPDEEVIVA
jgi:feruloyl-CoA synthase